jgi:hypothetical protein
MEDLKTFIQAGWQRHDSQTKELADELIERLPNVVEDKLLDAFLGLLTHTLGTHLGEWETLNKQLSSLLELTPENLVVREKLEIVALIQNSQDDFQHDQPSLNILLNALKEVIASEDFSRSATLLKQVKQQIKEGSELTDAIIKLLAIIGNNLASGLEAKPSLNDGEIDTMLDAARIARKNWAIAGGWLETERAEYVLAACYLKAGDVQQAMVHGRLCEEICIQNGADSFELFFANEMLTKIHWQRTQQIRHSVPDELKNYCDMPVLA